MSLIFLLHLLLFKFIFNNFYQSAIFIHLLIRHCYNLITFFCKMPLKTATCFDKMKPFLKEQGGDVVKKVGFVYHFEIAESKGK